MRQDGPPECPFCRIVAGQQAAEIVYRDELLTAFRDIRPQAPTHILIVPNAHIASLAYIDEKDCPLLGHIFAVINRLAAEEGIGQKGYRVVVNCGTMAGQTVPHLHFHLLGGRAMLG